ncbi:MULTISPECIES: DNA polymerase III subunit psi [Thalassotalea]|uniref:DNA polymerase III subunit psi n=1 Tax=Thalassotalea castellviae TaxID=3075612 RepID=A0ABU3A3B0_9GAMM|nr:DNA polymerase III subunit psi [Thalassotalea sp. W431]MDT0604661.1 DNA polymerase III subunit psi [Thalassotalea sp. W431]
MTITTRQFNHLKAMGITLWQRKNLKQTSSEVKEESTRNITGDFSANEINKLTIFQDILHALSIKPDDISWQKSHLDLGLFNWQFTDNANIRFEKATLITPSLDKIAQSPVAKKQLWQTFIQHNLNP